MRMALISAMLLAGLACAGRAGAAEKVIGLAAPLTGGSDLLGRQLLAGAGAGLGAAGGAARLEIADTACTAEGGAGAAERFVAARAAIVVGFLCIEAIDAAMPVLAAAGIPVLTPGVRVDGLTDRREKTRWPVFRLAPRADAESLAVARILRERWRDVLFAIIDDGTIHGRELAEAFRLAAEETGLRPVFTDTFRPQLDNQVGLAGRLRRAGATHVFAGGDRADIAILGRDAASLGYDLVIAGGEALRAARDEIDLSPGTLMIGLPEWRDIADAKVVERLRAEAIEPEGYVLPGHAAMEVAIAALGAAGEGDGDVAAALAAGHFRTALGDVTFDAKGDRTGSDYRLFRYDGEAFRPVD